MFSPQSRILWIPPPTSFYISYLDVNLHSGNSLYAKIINSLQSCICNSLIFLSCSFIYLAFPSYLLSAFLIYKTFRNAGQLCSFSSEEQKSFPLFALHLWRLGTGIEFHSSNMEFLVATVPILNVKLKADFAEGLV